MKRIKKFGVYQTAKVSAIIYFLMALIIMIPFWLILSITGANNIPGLQIFSGTFMIILPIFYGVMGFFITAIGCVIYNLIAQWTGGIEVEVETFDIVKSE